MVWETPATSQGARRTPPRATGHFEFVSRTLLSLSFRAQIVESHEILAAGRVLATADAPFPLFPGPDVGPEQS